MFVKTGKASTPKTYRSFQLSAKRNDSMTNKTKFVTNVTQRRYPAGLASLINKLCCVSTARWLQENKAVTSRQQVASIFQGDTSNSLGAKIWELTKSVHFLHAQNICLGLLQFFQNQWPTQLPFQNPWGHLHRTQTLKKTPQSLLQPRKSNLMPQLLQVPRGNTGFCFTIPR